MKKAIILAAGIGKRLGGLTKDIPKCLLEVEKDITLLDLSLKALKEGGIKEIILICGYQKDTLENHINKKWKDSFTFHFVFNEKFDIWNNIYSAYIAKSFFDDETLLLNSDIIYDPGILKNLLLTVKLTRGKMSYLVIDDKKDLIQEDMKVLVSPDNEIKQINKAIDIEEAYGEYIGIAYLRGNEKIRFFEAAEKLIQKGSTDLYYEDAIANTLNRCIVLPCSTGGLMWTEVDTKEDLDHAKEIYKKLNTQAVA